MALLWYLGHFQKRHIFQDHIIRSTLNHQNMQLQSFIQESQKISWLFPQNQTNIETAFESNILCFFRHGLGNWNLIYPQST